MRIRRVLVAQHRVDFRRGFDGLLAEAYRVGADPYDCDCVVFVKRDQRQLRVLFGDDLGLYLLMRRFEGGGVGSVLRFAAEPGTKVISSGELSLLLEGARFTVHAKARPWRGMPRRGPRGVEGPASLQA